MITAAAAALATLVSPGVHGRYSYKDRPQSRKKPITRAQPTPCVLQATRTYCCCCYCSSPAASHITQPAQLVHCACYPTLPGYCYCILGHARSAAVSPSAAHRSLSCVRVRSRLRTCYIVSPAVLSALVPPLPPLVPSELSLLRATRSAQESFSLRLTSSMYRFLSIALFCIEPFKHRN